MDIKEVLKLVWPLIVLQVGLQIYAIIDLLKRKKTRNLNVNLWIVIIIITEILGPVLYFLLGKAEEE